MKRNTKLWVVLVLLSGCSAPKSPTAKGTYYDLRTFVGHQIAHLNQVRPKVRKTVEINNRIEHIQTNAIEWDKELEVFAQADLNKPSYGGSYDVSDKTPNTYIYQLKNGENYSVKFLKVVLDNTAKQPKLIEAVLSTNNYLYSAERQIGLTCSVGKDGKAKLKNYRIRGYQQLRWGDKQSYSVSGELPD
jgi:hypothetical protein